MNVLNQVIIMALLILVGLLCYKLKIITRDGGRCISALVLNVSNPITVFLSFQKEFNTEHLAGLGYSALLAIICVAVAIAVSTLLVRGKDKDKRTIERFACMYSNCGFMGIPLINGVYGSEGVFYLTAFIAVFNLAVWTHGVVMMRGEFSPRGILKAIISPSIIAVILGLICFLTSFTLPGVIGSAAGYIGSLTTPLAMIVAGVTIAQADVKLVFKPRLYYISLVKLLIIPAATIGVFLLLPRNELIMGVNILAAACPTAAIGTMFAITFKKDSVYSAEIFAMTTVLSIAALPLVQLIFGLVFGQ